LKIFAKLLRFWKNDPLRGNFQNSVPKEFTSSPIDVLCLNFVKFGRRKIGKVMRYLPDQKKISPGCSAPDLATARIAPKICHASLRQCTQSAADFIQTGSLSGKL